MITHMTTHENTRSRHLDILAHHRSSQRAAISTAKRLPARRPSGHGYESEHYSRDATALWRRVGKLNTTLTDNSLILSDDFQSAVRSEEHTSELQSLMRNSYADLCLKKNKTIS